MTRRLVGAALVALLLVACGDDDTSEQDAAASATTESITPPTSQEPITGGLEIPEIPGTVQAPIPSIGFGVAFPDGWDATRLDAEALERLAGARLERPGFLDAAHAVARTGAVFYAAGTDDQGRVGELKVDVQDGADTTPDGVRALADQIAATDGFVDTSVSADLADGRVRVDYRIRAAGEDDEGAPIDTFGSQLLVPDGDRLWSLIVTSEDQASQDALLTIFATSFTLAET